MLSPEISSNNGRSVSSGCGQWELITPEEEM